MSDTPWVSSQQNSTAIRDKPHCALARTLDEQMRDWCASHANRIALVAGDQRVTYQALNDRIDQLAGGFLRLGIAQGDRVMMQLPNGIDFLSALFALFRVGGIPILAMPTLGERDIDALCRLAEPIAYLVADQIGFVDYLPRAERLASAQPSLRHVIVNGRQHPDWHASTPLTTLASLNAPLPADIARSSPSDTALMLLSGGSTGTPKLIPRTHADYAYAFTHAATLCGVTDATTYLAVLPAAHNFTLSSPGILGTLCRGGKVVLAENASCDETFPLIEHERVTHVALVPPLARLWCEARAWEHSDLSSLALLQVGGSRLAPELARDLVRTFPCRLQQVFGMAEGLNCYTRLDDPLETILHTQGRPLSDDDEIRIVDDSDHPVPRGETGELLTRGPYTIHAYYRAPAQSARAFTTDGFYRTGDLVRQTADGNLIVVGRIKEQIHRAGEKLAAADIEDAIRQYTDIQDVVAVAVPDSILGERACAFLRTTAALPDVATLRQGLLSRGFGAAMLPDQIIGISHWPTTPIGKIDKLKLATMAKTSS